MTNNNNESGTTQTALSTPTEVHDPKLMVIALNRDENGEIVITPIDVEHTTDDQTPLTENELKAKKLLDSTFTSNEKAMHEALNALYMIFEHRLYRNQFRTFENFCFSMYGTNRINDAMMKKARKKTEALEAELREES